MIFCGIDPGQKGAIVFLNADGLINGWTMFEDINWKEVLSFMINRASESKVVLEKLWGMPVRGCQGNWALGANYGKWQLILDLAGVSYTEIPPTTWQKLILNTSKKKSAETKPLSLAYVNKRFPSLNLPCKRKIDIDTYSGISDAICMALYARHLHLNKL